MKNLISIQEKYISDDYVKDIYMSYKELLRVLNKGKVADWFEI